MPKSVYIELAVPSNSRPEKLHAWLNGLLAPHRISVLTLEETPQTRAQAVMPEIRSDPQ
jgi:hypothetical protein